MVRLRQMLDVLRHRLQFVPIAGVALAIVVAQVTLSVDSALEDDALPEVLRTTVGSGRSILSAIAGGLISAAVLLMSMMLVAVQLASSQFSPRTIRNWLGDRTQQLSLAIVLGTTVYCLLILRQTRSLDEGEALTPHLSVIIAVVLGIGSLIAVVRSVDHLTDRLRIGSVAAGIMSETVAIVERNARVMPVESPSMVPASMPTDRETPTRPPADAVAIEAPCAGWIQQIDIDQILTAVPDGGTLYVAVAVGSFTLPNAPVAWLSPPPDDPDVCARAILNGFAFGDGRTMQQDIGFGLTQMVDIALRALSPGVNDPNTANDLIANIGVVLLALWERPIGPHTKTEDRRTVIRFDLDHADYLHLVFDPIRLYGTGDPSVADTMVRTLAGLRSEVIRRELAGPIEPIDEVIDQILDAVEATELSEFDKQTVRDVAPHVARTMRADP